MGLRQRRRLARSFPRWLVIATAACIALACTPIQQTPASPTAFAALDDTSSCPIVPPVIIDLVQQRSTRQAAQEAVTTRLGISAARDSRTDSSHSQWTTEEGQTYLLGFVDDRLTRVDLQWEAGQVPTLGEGLVCLGQPVLYDYVLERFQIPYQYLMLWYPESGLILEAWVQATEGVPGNFSLDKSLDWVYIVPAGTPLEMATLRYSVPGSGILSEREIKALVARLKPWPGSIEHVELTDCLSNPDVCNPD